MIESLATIMSDFPGEANRARCLAHIVNLVVKIILRQFDVPRKKEKEVLPPNDSNLPDLPSGNDVELEEDLEELARALDKEGKEMDEGDEEDDEDSECLERDVEKIEEAMEEEIKGVVKMAKPVQQVLFKVRGLDSLVLGFLASTFFFLPFFVLPFFMLPFFALPLFLSCFLFLFHRYLMLIYSLFLSQLRKLAYAIKNSTTIILPRWNEVIEQCAANRDSTTKKKLAVRKMPRDVENQWNSTYDMLKFAFAYSEPINNITGDRSMKIRQYELVDHEWTIVEQLRDCLKVCIFFMTYFASTLRSHIPIL